MDFSVGADIWAASCLLSIIHSRQNIISLSTPFSFIIIILALPYKSVPSCVCCKRWKFVCPTFLLWTEPTNIFPSSRFERMKLPLGNSRKRMLNRRYGVTRVEKSSLIDTSALFDVRGRTSGALRAMRINSNCFFFFFLKIKQVEDPHLAKDVRWNVHISNSSNSWTNGKRDDLYSKAVCYSCFLFIRLTK